MGGMQAVKVGVLGSCASLKLPYWRPAAPKADVAVGCCGVGIDAAHGKSDRIRCCSLCLWGARRLLPDRSTRRCDLRGLHVVSRVCCLGWKRRRLPRAEPALHAPNRRDVSHFRIQWRRHGAAREADH